MSTETTEVNAASSRPEAGEMRLEVVVIPVADVARDLRVLRHVQRSGRQHLAAAGDHDTAAETLSPRPAAR
jgi:hypothetical protein